MLLLEGPRGALVFLLLPLALSSLLLVIWDFCNGMEKEEGCLYVVLKLVVRLAIFLCLLLFCLKLGDGRGSMATMSWAAVFSPLWLVAAILAIFAVFSVFHLFYKTIRVFMVGRKELDDYKLAWWIFLNVVGSLFAVGGFLFRVGDAADRGVPFEQSLWVVVVCLVATVLCLLLTFFSYKTL